MSHAPPAPRGLRSLGPAIIVASVVLGPGSILSSSRVGADHGYDMAWVVALAAILMVGMTALSARLGVLLDGTPCDELARRLGRPVAAAVGLCLFLIVACFQFSNNLGILAAIRPFVGDSREWAWGVLLVLNGTMVAFLFGFRSLYRPLELMMKVLVGVMILGFAGNLLLSSPSVGRLLAGLLPSLPEGAGRTIVPLRSGTEVVDHLLPVQALIATTFSVGGAFYQAYLVRQKGWTREHLGRGLVDSAVGIGVLGATTLMILVTAAAVLHGKIAGKDLKDAGDVALQLQPLFGKAAVALFSAGLFAGAFSSFLVNSMIGGTLLSDGFGRGGSMDRLGPKIGTVAALASGMAVALYVTRAGAPPVALILFAQALTVLGNPVLAGALLWLATRPDMRGERAVPAWLKALATAGFLLSLFLAVRTAVAIYYRLTT